MFSVIARMSPTKRKLTHDTPVYPDHSITVTDQILTGMWYGLPTNNHYSIHQLKASQHMVRLYTLTTVSQLTHGMSIP